VNPTGNIYFLTGERDSGKTIVCDRVIKEMAGIFKTITGVVSPGRYENERKTGIYCLDLATGDKKILAFYSPGWDEQNPQREWEFLTETLHWGNELLANSIPTDLLVIDEIGFLEFEKDEGWTNALAALDSRKFSNALVVIRPALIENALARYPDANVFTISSIEDRELIIQQLVSLFSIIR
jgi:nucleoside-triphosphatase THEP1